VPPAARGRRRSRYRESGHAAVEYAPVGGDLSKARCPVVVVARRPRRRRPLSPVPGCDASHGVDIDCIISFKPAILKRNVEPLPELLDRSRLADDPNADAPDVEHALELI